LQRLFYKVLMAPWFAVIGEAASPRSDTYSDTYKDY